MELSHTLTERLSCKTIINVTPYGVRFTEGQGSQRQTLLVGDLDELIEALQKMKKVRGHINDTFAISTEIDEE